MKGQEAAASLRKLANVLEKYNSVPIPKKDALDEELQLGAAAMLMFIRDLFTVSGKDAFTRDEILVLLNMLQNDRDIFTIDIIAVMESD